ncbi:CLUMA_CG003168, isoform A [Clunio marinus]|uniref:CLUMA_CG003168, isoform A n=1 Tax=Clunio marinus TaxID=568069 RepID=A0A1J1HN88_9DIPT|nr:CLUMA_CG003168, isoform A [Clunio marinus]
MLTEHKVLNEIMFTHTQAGAFLTSIASQYTRSIFLIVLCLFCPLDEARWIAFFRVHKQQKQQQQQQIQKISVLFEKP